MTTRLKNYGTLVVVGAVVGGGFAGTAEAATPKYYNNQATFKADMVVNLTDDYSNAGYVFGQSNVVMSAVLGETEYFTTGHMNNNLVPQSYYCAGCNGSFRLSFQSTSIGTATGITGVGAFIKFHDQGLPYFAFITFADGTTANIQLPLAGNFWGVSAPERIKDIHFGLSNAGTTQAGSFGIDDLILGEGCTTDVACNDNNACNGAEKCVANKCVVGAALDCNDDNVCTNDSCDAVTGCVNADNAAPCEDADMCTVNTVCAGGECGVGTPLDCVDDDVCTVDVCEAASGCGNTPIDGCCKADGDCAADEFCDLDSNTCALPMTGSTSTGDESTSTGDESTSTGGESTSTGDASTGEPIEGSSGGPIETTGSPSPTSGEPGPTTGGSASDGEPVTTTVDPETGTPTSSDSEGPPVTPMSGGFSDSDTVGVNDEGCSCDQTRGDPWLGALVSLGFGLALRRRRRG